MDEVADDEIRRLVAESDGERLDAFLAGRLDEISRSRAAQLIADGHVTVNERIPKKSEKVAAGDIVLVTLPPAEPSTVTPEDIPLSIIYQDQDLVIVDKPSGLVVHPAVGHARGTLVRPLTDQERQLVQSDLQTYLDYYRSKPDDAKAFVSVGESKADEKLDVPTLAAWTMVCNQFLNLDETLNK